MQDSARKDTVHLELTLVRGVKGNRKTLHPYISSERLSKKNGGPLLNGVGDLVTAETSKAEALIAFFASVSPRRSSRPLCLEKRLKGEENNQQW